MHRSHHCCGEPHALVRHVVSPSGEITLATDECTGEVCGWAPSARRWGRWHHVGELASGRYAVTSSTTTATVLVR